VPALRLSLLFVCFTVFAAISLHRIHIKMASESAPPTFDIPKECIAGVVKDEGPNFWVSVEKVPVPEIGECFLKTHNTTTYRTI